MKFPHQGILKLGMVEGEWVVGVIDEIRMPLNEAVPRPLLVDTKTRYKATLPTEAQMRNSRFQLMCYKYLWDCIVADNFPSGDFYKCFDLDPQSTLSEDVGEYSARLGLRAKTLEDVVNYFIDTCYLLPSSQEKLMLRYEYQRDHSLLKEYVFDHDANWFKGQILKFLEFWSGVREASFVSKDEQWKCQFCKYASICSVTAGSDCSYRGSSTLLIRHISNISQIKRDPRRMDSHANPNILKVCEK
ncbi:hypothetical protein Taro_049773 [Colocasia esculenta]|uniref:Exonuclease V n=1 Tax=Colocasia esculenta TaxID=4460 RepID=A0A843XBN8_COLES|nr:hypothetical protein [Colocasia esculenta]